MNERVYFQLLAILVGWSMASCGSAIFGLYRGARPYWKSFWLMTGAWGVVGGIIAAAALALGPMPASELGPILRINAGLDGLYLAFGAILCTLTSPRWSGFGLAVAIQGFALLIFDVVFWLQCGSQ